MAKGTVLFVDTGRWTCFDQFGAALRRAGHRTVRITVESSRLSRFISRMAYSECIVVPHEEAIGELASLVDLAEVVDVQCTEAVLATVCDAVAGTAIPAEVREHLEWRLQHLDKLRVAQRLAAAGVPVPLSMAGVSAQEACSVLGLPMVLKTRSGFGGAGVRVTRTVEEAVAAYAELAAQDVFFEEYFPGEIMRYVACRTEQVTLEEAVFVAHRADAGSLGPATAVELVDDAAMIRIGRAVLAALGGRGLANIEAVRTVDGRYAVIDVNLRTWGSALALRSGGPDFVHAYLSTLAPTAPTAPTAAGGAVAVGGVFEVFPDAAVAAVDGGSVLAAAALVVGASWRYARWTGPRYVVGASALVAASLVRRGRR
ncbi:ATP-grasp domain-containing protein [Luteipulveratus sp. YIM 133132]|uniref:ATP-grasp domain-containing protein n=1 Tax=Luteipulveratus flavus TaxID=3031728 RepID=UPI0023B0B2B7|nr:ATP-grasp domain-containing protein [Luteipulveratus sp. YIM 133132]MDE9366675.1 ATP-grasp domain-containing protein [Luteipulveratus sp. YIM 133132]